MGGGERDQGRPQVTISSWHRRLGAAAILLALGACGDGAADFSQIHGKWKWDIVGFADECLGLIAEFSVEPVRIWFLHEEIACWNIERVGVEGVAWVLGISSHLGLDGRSRCEGTGSAGPTQSSVMQVKVAQDQLYVNVGEDGSAAAGFVRLDGTCNFAAAARSSRFGEWVR